MSESKPAVIVLAAGSIKNKYHSYSFRFNSPALVPIASRSTISFILDFYEQQDIPVHLAINKDDEGLFMNELSYYTNVRLIPIAESKGVCDTLSQAVVQVNRENVIVNLATTIPTQLPADRTVYLDTNLSDNNYYSGVVAGEGQRIFKTKKDALTAPFHAFTGLFRGSRKHLLEALEDLQTSTDLLDVVKVWHNIEPLHFVTIDWIDTGHEINYADARRKLISSRSFNAITVDGNSGILTKKSLNKEKLAQEVKYVGMLPTELQILYPRILSQNAGEGTVLMEYYGYPNLAEYQLYRELEPLWWQRIFNSLGHSLQLMHEHGFSIGPRAFDQFYLHKTVERVNTYLRSLQPGDIYLTEDRFTINGVECSNVNVLRDRMAEKIRSLYNEDDFCVMHGDFCFNNILFDTVSNTVKLIDPRGSFGETCVGIYGDRKYDLAKLMHSTVGHYDYIVNNLFRIDHSGTEINYSFPLRDNHEVMARLSDELLDKLGASKNDILFIVGLLFLSMCPLHADSPQRQRLMYAHGLYFLNKHI